MNTYYSKDRKGATDRRLVPQDVITKKVTLPLARGGYFFVFLIISNNNVTMIPSIIRTIDNNSKSLIHIPSLSLDFLCNIRVQ